MAPTSGSKVLDDMVYFETKQRARLLERVQVLEEKVKDLETIINVVNAKLQGFMERKEE